MPDKDEKGSADQKGTEDKSSLKNDKPDGEQGKSQPDEGGQGEDLKSLQAQKEHFREKALKYEQELSKIRETEEKKKEEEMKANQEFEQLAAKKDEELKTLREEIKQRDLRSALTGKLYQQNPVDMEAALKLVDMDKVSFDDEGKPQVDEAIEDLVSTKQFLFSEEKKAINSGKQPPTNDGKQKLTISSYDDISKMSAKEKAENIDAIREFAAQSK